MTRNLRFLSAEIIHKVKQGSSLADCLPLALKKITDLRDQALVQMLVFGVCRFYPRLESILNFLLEKPLKEKESKLHALMLIGLFQLLATRIPEHAVLFETVKATNELKKPWAKGLVNAILRKFLSQQALILEKIDEEEEARFSHPTWWIQKIKHEWPNHWQQILNANNDKPPLTLRVNAKIMSANAYLNILKEQKISASALPETTQGIILEPLPVEAIPGFSEGWLTVQDGAAQLAATLLDLKTGQHVLDACAAPGGKLTHLFELAEHLSVVAVEKESSRCIAISENIKRLNQQSQNLQIICHDAGRPQQWWDGKAFDRILLDTPCSASGVLRRHPDIKLLRKSTDLSQLIAEQKRLLNALWPLLKVNGLLLYATCSIFPEENEQIIAAFLQTHADAHEQTIPDIGLTRTHGRQIIPGMYNMDGFFYALLHKQT